MCTKYIIHFTVFSSVQLSRFRLFATPWIAARQASLSITNSRSSLKLTSIKSVDPAISSSVFPFSSCPQSLPVSESFPMSQLFTLGGQSIRVSASTSGFGIVNKAEVSIFSGTFLLFLMNQQMLAIWSPVSLLFLNSSWTSKSSQFMYCLKPRLENFQLPLLAC